MKEYFRYFRFWFMGLLAVFVIWLFTVGGKMLSEGEKSERANKECVTKERVFDIADVLTNEEEEKLRTQISKYEEELKIDIVLVTLNESLKEYAKEYDPNVTYDKFVMIYADNFYDEHKFGYNKPIGDGVLLLDNIYREDDGKVYTWMCTTGKAEDRYSSGMINRALDVFYENVDENPYIAYSDFLDRVYADMSDKAELPVPWYTSLFAAFTAAAVFILVNMTNRKGKKTTTQRSYVKSGQPQIRRREDVFLRKSVASRTIETSSGGGHGVGGGHHSSSSGASHGGGGHSR